MLSANHKAMTGTHVVRERESVCVCVNAMSLPALYLRPSPQTDAIFDDVRLSGDTLASIAANASDCRTILQLSAVNENVRNLMRADYFWSVVAEIRGLKLQSGDSPFILFFASCFVIEIEKK